MTAPDWSDAKRSKDTCVRRPCRVYNLWPELKTYKSRDINAAFSPGDTRVISLYVQTFMNRPNFSTPAQPLSTDLGYSHIRFGKDRGFWLGNVVVGERDEGSFIKKGSPVGNVEQISRYQGEVDVGIMFYNVQEDDPAILATMAGDIIDIAIPFLATGLNEHLVPIIGTQVDEYRGTDHAYSAANDAS